ncbi:MAG: ATP-binding cassette domain-containing protein [Acidimicrobiales bacterium]
MGTLFSFEGVAVAFGGAEILSGVDLDLPEGGCTVLVGPSGSGKSTLLRLCNRLEAPSAGVLRFRGEDVATLDPRSHRRRVGMVFQRPVAFGGSVLDNLRVARPEVTYGQAVEALVRVGLVEAFLAREQATLSGGEGQRACLARTLLAEPEVLLLDEPTASLDAAAAAGLERLTTSLADGGTSLLWVTHDTAQADRLADRLVVVGGGGVEATWT